MRWMAVGVVGVLALAGCGGSDSSSDGGNQESNLSADQTTVVSLVIESAADEGLTMDESCVSRIISRMSDADAKAIADAGLDGDPDVSDEGDALGAELLNCVDREAFIDALVADLSTQGIVLNRECVLDAIKDFEVSDIVSGADSLPPEVSAALEACVVD